MTARQSPPPLCLVINGPSAVGKSTLTRAVQDRAGVALLRFGVDELFRMVPDKWGSMGGARRLGFRYEDVEGRPGVRRITTGADGRLMLDAMNAAVEAMLRVGQGVVVDGQAFEPEVNCDLERRLAGLAAEGRIVLAVVELVVGDADLEDRQSRHEHPAGLALFHNALPPQSTDPHLVLDTTGRDAAQVAATLWAWLVARYPPIAGGGPATTGG